MVGVPMWDILESTHSFAEFETMVTAIPMESDGASGSGNSNGGEVNDDNTGLQARQELLMHSCPTGDGLIAVQRDTHFNAFFSHASPPLNNVNQVTQRYSTTTSASPCVSLTATRAIDAGEEFTVDYDASVGYEAHCDEPHVAAFLRIWEAHGVDKRPSRLTIPGARVEVAPG